MNTLARNLFGTIILAWLGWSVAACSLFTSAPPATPTPTVTATATATATNTPTPFNKDGLWDGGMTSDATFSGAIQFLVEKSQLTEVTLNYTLRSGGCTEQVVTSGTFDETKMMGNNFTARAGDSTDKRQLIITGTFASAIEASGTLEFRGAMEGCGNFDKVAKWSAHPIPPRPTRTPTPPPPTATQPRPTATNLPTTPGSAGTPSGWKTLKSARFSIIVPPGFDSYYPLQDAQPKPNEMQDILRGEDRETGLFVGVRESVARFASREEWLEARKRECIDARPSMAILKAQSGVKVNGRDAAILECNRDWDRYALGGYFIVVGQEEFEIVVIQSNADATNFIANAERIASSFVVDAPTATPATTKPGASAPSVTPAATKPSAPAPSATPAVTQPGTAQDAKWIDVVRAFFAALNARNLDAAMQYVDNEVMVGTMVGNTRKAEAIGKSSVRSYFQAQLAAGAQYAPSNLGVYTDFGMARTWCDLKVSNNPAWTKATIFLNEQTKIFWIIFE